MFKVILFLLLIGVLILAALSLYLIIKPYTEKIDCLALYSGGPGSGKTFFGCHQALVLLRKNRFKVFLKNINPINRIKRKPWIEKPKLYSNIPIRISFSEWSTPITADVFALQRKLPGEKYVVFIDEFNLFLSQMDYKLESEQEINTFVSLFRHFSKNGFLVVTTQNVQKCHWVLRYCLNRSYNLCEFRKPIFGLPILAWTKCRHISIGEDIKTIEQVDVDDGRRNLLCFFPFFGLPFFRWYDTHAYSDIIKPLPDYTNVKYRQYKRNTFMSYDTRKKYPKLINTDDEFVSGGVGSERVKPPDQNINSNNKVIKKYCRKGN